jgi:5-methylcytosine-specific restriction enzyme A
MPAFLLTWKPLRWHWESFGADVDRVRSVGHLPSRWSCGNTKRIRAGDRLFLLRQGRDRPGLIGSGWATSESYSDTHWEDHDSFVSREAQYVDVDWDAMSVDAVIPRSELLQSAFAAVNWNTQSSGIVIDDEIVRPLELEWGRRIGSLFEPSPDEVTGSEYPEGAIHRIAVNAHERNARARKACIEHYGCKCMVCDVDLAERYGRAARDLIHVHHLKPLAAVSSRYKVDAIRDLRPVCPNCHAVIHRSEPPYDPEEVRAMLQQEHRQSAPG